MSDDFHLNKSSPSTNVFPEPSNNNNKQIKVQKSMNNQTTKSTIKTYPAKHSKLSLPSGIQDLNTDKTINNTYEVNNTVSNKPTNTKQRKNRPCKDSKS